MSNTDSSTTVAIRKQKMVSQKKMASIELERIAEENEKNRQESLRINRGWLEKMTEEFEKEFQNETEILCLAREKVFEKWEKARFKRTFALAYTDLFRVFKGYCVDDTARLKYVIEKVYETYEKETGIHVRILPIAEI